MQVVFDHSHEEAPNIRTFYFRPEQPMQYTAGQYTQLTVPHVHPDERGDKHWFTLSSSPTDELVTITTKYNPERSSSFKKALFNLKPGTELHMADPHGDFVLPKLIQTPLLFVAGGIGVTPFHSMLAWLVATGEERPIKLLYGVRSEDEIVFQDTFDKAGVKPTFIVSQPSDAWGGERGNLSAELIMGLGQPTEDALVYVSGPEPMVEILAKDLTKTGLRKDHVVLDSFPNYTIDY